MVAEKWPSQGDSGAFETIYEYLKAGLIQMTLDIPQGPIAWETVTDPDGHHLERKVSTELAPVA